MNLQKVNVFWFRRDLRFEDNAALYYALSGELLVLPIFIFDKNILDELDEATDARVNFIHASVENLQSDLVKKGRSLLAFIDTPIKAFKKLTEQFAVHTVFANHDYEPYAKKRDKEISDFLSDQGILFKTFKDQVIFEKDEVVKNDGGMYTVYTPYSKKWLSLVTKKDYAPYESEKLVRNFFQFAERKIPSLHKIGFKKTDIDFPSSKIDATLIKNYHKTRDIPGQEGTTRLGMHLRFGTVSIRNLLKHALHVNEVYAKELIWREFFMQILWHKPSVVNHCFKPAYENIRWRNNEKEFKHWCAGETGYPIVDAGMRQLNETGFMHNRVRMITASFLVKHLLIDWRWGEAYFAKKLLDYELSSNNGNWQWAAGCGCDAAPYFRIFNPTTQAKKFDPQEVYIKRWVPEVETKTYPKPIVVHELARDRCLKVYKQALQNQPRLFDE